ncbi:hypothetical protein [Kluyvera ascorbata]|uniref:hypothetical protein n=1 Tax=Kluyvera ascorbata TaxID=51288 RepID=UPI0028A164AC|nr:hypothetical protein [Kluyvera ascorbata]
MTIVDKDLYSNIALRVRPGTYVNFPIVDNVGVFEHYKCSGKESGYDIETFLLDDGNCYAIYKNDSGISYLFSAFASSADVGDDSLEIILNHFPYLLKGLGFDIEYVLHTNIDNLPAFHHELYLKVRGTCYLVSTIEDIENLTALESKEINKFPGALESINKAQSYLHKKTIEAYK